ncbi:hypothetical protein QC762_0060680 [Podospora pseudocomata]|uniref:Uncharacterized protein n=1 Tax=Podospora pseudocomata TaxID=2093779 RepID=A0ABR0GLD4_9PEZI|nr:hypothetical protein QC762_0060680 [Podospora pseudocomata]
MIRDTSAIDRFQQLYLRQNPAGPSCTEQLPCDKCDVLGSACTKGRFNNGNKASKKLQLEVGGNLVRAFLRHEWLLAGPGAVAALQGLFCLAVSTGASTYTFIPSIKYDQSGDVIQPSQVPSLNPKTEVTSELAVATNMGR